MKVRSDIGQGKKNTRIIKYTLLCKFLYIKYVNVNYLLGFVLFTLGRNGFIL